MPYYSGDSAAKERPASRRRDVATKTTARGVETWINFTLNPCLTLLCVLTLHLPAHTNSNGGLKRGGAVEFAFQLEQLPRARKPFAGRHRP